MAGYIKIYRDILDSVLFRKPVLMQIWLLLAKEARYVKTVQDGIEVQPGQVLITISELAKCSKQPERRVRYVLDCLEEMELISCANIRNRYTLITLSNPDELHGVRMKDVKKPTETTTAQPEEVKKAAYGEFGNVYLTDDEKRRLKERTTAADSYIDRLSAYKRRTDKVYNDDFAVLCEWISKDDITAAGKPAIEPKADKHQAPEKTNLSQYPGSNTDFMTSPASYDLAKAEMIARTTVPTLRKRKRPGM